MTPRETAQELVDKFSIELKALSVIDHRDDITLAAKQCALICVDEIMGIESQFVSCEWCPYTDWQQVKTEIENL
jgi:hypothetical protein